MTYGLDLIIPFFQDTLDGKKRHEIRSKIVLPIVEVGDVLCLYECDGNPDCYTGRTCRVRVTWISPATGMGKDPDFQYMSIEPIRNRWWNRIFGK